MILSFKLKNQKPGSGGEGSGWIGGGGGGGNILRPRPPKRLLLRNKGQTEPGPGPGRGVGPGLAVDAVRLGLPRRADDPHEAVSKLLQDQPLGQRLRLPAQLRLPGLVQEALARRLHHLLGDKRERQPVGDKKDERCIGWVKNHSWMQWHFCFCFIRSSPSLFIHVDCINPLNPQ